MPACCLGLGVVFPLKLPPPSVSHSTSFSNQSPAPSHRHRHRLEMYLLLGVVRVRKIPQGRGRINGHAGKDWFGIMIDLK